MVIPGLNEVPRLIAESGFTEDEILNRGLQADGLVFMVVVPELGACRVPDEALSHFMAGADEYAADGMPEHWSKQPSGPWTIKRDRLRVLADSWEKHLILRDRIQAALYPDPSPAIAAPVAPTAPAPGKDTAKPAPVADGEWITQAQARAREIIKESREHDRYPSQVDISDRIAAEFRKSEIFGSDGKPLAGASIKRHALKGISSAKGKQLSTTIGRGK